jgi:hypothetical protein
MNIKARVLNFITLFIYCFDINNKKNLKKKNKIFFFKNTWEICFRKIYFSFDEIFIFYWRKNFFFINFWNINFFTNIVFYTNTFKFSSYKKYKDYFILSNTSILIKKHVPTLSFFFDNINFFYFWKINLMWIFFRKYYFLNLNPSFFFLKKKNMQNFFFLDTKVNKEDRIKIFIKLN